MKSMVRYQRTGVVLAVVVTVTGGVAASAGGMRQGIGGCDLAFLTPRWAR